jgi:hypothetical protein
VVYNPIACATVTGLAATLITATTATISWTAVSGSTGYIYAVDNSATPPASGTFTTATSVPLTGLTASTSYYAHVYDSCAVGSESAWTTIEFNTSPLGINNINSTDFAITSYPNPVKDELTIKITGGTGNNSQIALMDISGRQIKSITPDAFKVNISMTGLPSGIYLVRYTDARHTQTIKINKQ